MTRVSFAVCLCVMSFALTGCDADKIARLEKQNQDLQDQLKKQQALASLEFQSKCSRDARTWFHENWRGDKDTTLLDFTNHYNKVMNKCLIVVEYHYSIGDVRGSWMNDMTMWDVYENAKYAQYSESHMMAKDFLKVTDSVISCNPPSGNKCKSIQEFNNAITSYMNN
jgi:hypothetical protein